jgi:hypothetical protein
VETSYVRALGGTTGKRGDAKRGMVEGGTPAGGMTGKPTMNRCDKTIGWQPSCSCSQTGTTASDDLAYVPFEPVPCVVLDPFIGSGTVAKVAIRLRRNWIGIDLNEKYFELAEKRTAWTQIELV